MTPTRPAVVAFDVNETLSDLTPLRDRLAEVGAPPQLLETWFNAVLRDGFALAATGGYADFGAIAVDLLHAMLTGIDGLPRPRPAAQFVADGFASLPPHPEVAEAMRRLHRAGVRLVTLTNGNAELTKGLLERAGVADLVELRLSVAEVRRWKPAAEPYRYAATRCGVPVQSTALVAVHPWDVHGARRAGLIGVWVNRRGEPWPGFFPEPDATGADLVSAAEALLG